MKNTVQKQKRKLSSKQLVFIFIPFVSTVCYWVYLFFKGKYYTKNCLVSSVKAILSTFATGVALGIIGVFSYTATLIVSQCMMGIIFNLVFFKSYNNMTKQ